MRRLWLTLAALAMDPAMGLAQSVLRGGEHPDFTRLVLEAPGLQTWALGRSDIGYALDFQGGEPKLDLSQAFDRIPKSRISGLWQDPQSGRLRIALSCACHAEAFEFRKGILVIDIRDGPAPAGAGFEAALPELVADLAPIQRPPAQPLMHPRSRPKSVLPQAAVEPPIPTSDPGETREDLADFTPFRSALMERITIGAAEGLIDMAEQTRPAVDDLTAPTPGTRISLGEMPGIKLDSDDAPIAADGMICPAEADLDLTAWLPAAEASKVMALPRQGLFGEFDHTDPAAVMAGAKIYLALGFGAEARQLLTLLPKTTSDPAALLDELGALIDLEAPLQSRFTHFAACDNAAALWAALAWSLGSHASKPLENLNIPAVLRGFSALPIHLRRHLGPALGDYFLAQGDQATALQLRDAILRLPDLGHAGVALMDAQLKIATGEAAEAAVLAQDLMGQSPLSSADAAVALTEAALLAKTAVPPELPDQLEAFLADAGDPARRNALYRALILASAMRGDFARAFQKAGEERSNLAPQTWAALWQLTAQSAEDAVFLPEALMAAARANADLSLGAETRVNAGKRLNKLGFPKEALLWLGGEAAQASLDWQLTAAEAHLALRDGRAALRVLAGIVDPAAEALRAAAALQIGDEPSAASAYRRLGEVEAEGRALRLGGDWGALAGREDAPSWTAVAQLLEEAAPSSEGTPAETDIGFESEIALADGARATAGAVENLLKSLPNLPAVATGSAAR